MRQFLFSLIVIADSLWDPILYRARFSHFNPGGGLSFSFAAHLGGTV